ncbi:MAG: ABC transporter transmembrane domain-containing protein [Burkholderiales bacterium]
MSSTNPRTAPGSPRSLSGLLPLIKPYKGRITLALLFMLLAAIATLALPLALRGLIDGGVSALTANGDGPELRNHFFALFAVAVAMGLFSAARFYMVSWIGERVTADLRNAVYAHVLRQSPEFFETTQTGEVLSRLTSDTTLVQTVIGSSLSMGLRNAVMGAGALALLVWMHPSIMGLVLAVLAVVVLPSTWFGRRVYRLSRASQDRVADASAIAAEVLNAVPVVQSYTAEERETERFARSTQSAFEAAVYRTRARSALVAFIMIATSGALLWGLYRGTLSVLAGALSAGQLSQIVVYVIILAGALAVLGEVYGDVLRAAGATERLIELLYSPYSIVSPEKPVVAPVPVSGSAIKFESVTFHYPSRPLQPALRGFTLSVRPGETVALVGPSGAGKSTVFQLLLRAYDPAQGKVVLDGVETRTLHLHELRARIGIVPQDAVVFSTSALENIRYGRPDATDSEVEAAAQAAFADGFIRNLPEGYGTFLGERGVRLSGGQRQRIAIARAILKNPPLLLLDEATSALDVESERMVQAALESAMRGRTTLVIAHRLATVQKADRIVVLDHGRIVEQGTHQTLAAGEGIYARLAALQFAA